MKKSTFLLPLLLLTLTSCAVERSSSLPPEPPPVLSAAPTAEPQQAAAKAEPVWDVRDNEVVWGTLNEAAEAESEDAELVEEAEVETGTETGAEANRGSVEAQPTVSELTAGRLRRAASDDTTSEASSVDAAGTPDPLTGVELTPAAPAVRVPTDTGATAASAPPAAENGSYYGEISPATGRPKTVHVQGYYRKDGTYVRGHYRSPPRRRN